MKRGTSTLRGNPTEWQDRSRRAARARPGRAPNSTLPAVGPRGAAKKATAAAVRPTVWERTAAAQGSAWLVRCTYPHTDPLMAGCRCSAPGPDHRVGPTWAAGDVEPDPANWGYLALCHVIPVDLAGPLAWHPHNLFVGCDNGNGWQEDHTSEAIALGVHARMGDHVFEGRRVPDGDLP